MKIKNSAFSAFLFCILAFNCSSANATLICENLPISNESSFFCKTPRMFSYYSLTIRTVAGLSPIIIEVQAYHTIESIKGQIYNKTGFKVENMMLFHAGKRLEDGRTLDDYNIGRGSTLHLIMR